MPGKKQPPSSSRGPKGKVPAYQLSARGLRSSRTSGSLPQAPEIHITGPQETQNLNSIRRNGQDGSTGSHLEEPPSDSEISPLCCTTGWFGRWSSLNCGDRSTTPQLELSAVHHPVPDTPQLSPSHLDPKQPARSTRSIDTAPDSASSLHSQPERVELDPDVDSLLEPAPGKKPIIIGTTELILQAAATALKFSPIPLLSDIPGLLLTFLQVYKTVDSNSENLKGLDNEVVKAYTTILRPLQLWTGEIPPEVKALIKEFHLALDEQTKQIRVLSSQKLATRIVSASDVTQRVNSVKTCINNAVTSFLTEAAISTLLHTIQSSTRTELSRLPRVPAEHTYVTAKSECLEGTREKIQASIVEHLKKAGNRFVWLRGSPGMGKTAISLSIASDLEKQCILAASFFWDKNQPGTGLDSIKQFPSTIAHQLASFNEEFKLSLVKRLRQRGFELVQNLPLEKQMRALVVEPMGDLKNLLLSSKDRFIIILDGLDECGDQEALGTLMKLVLMLGALPSTFTVLVSSRPEPQVISAWVDAEGGGFNIPYEDVDEIGEETLHTVRCMVEEGLQDCVKKSAWKPSPEDFDTFASACRGLPVMASIRIRDVRTRTQRGSTLKREFEYLRNLRDAPLDLKSEYLRILRRAYMSDQSTIPSHVAENYRQVIGTIIAAYKPLSLNSMSQLLGIAEDELRATLEPIGSIVEFSSEKSRPLQSLMRVLRITPDAVYPKFYHATMKEFLTDHPFGHESDQPFFISDLEGHFLGPPLLRLVNDVIKRNKSKIRSFGDSKKRKELQEKQQPEHVQYAFRYLFYHLDPSRLSSQDSNEFSSEFDVFLTRNLLSFFMLSQFDFELPDELLRSNNHNLTEWFEEVNRVKDIIIENKLSPSHIFRSILPFTPSSSPLFKSYGHLSDPIRIFSITGEPSSHSIPLSGDTLSAQRAMEAKLSVLPIEVGGSGMDETDSIDRGAELLDPDIRNGIVTAAALSRDGRYIALGFGNGVIEVADIDHQHTVTRFQCDPPNLPAWIEFICGSHRIATEDNEGNIRVFSHGSPSVKIGTLPSGPCLPVTLVADNGSFIIRVPRNMDCHWCESMAILYVSDEPSIHPLSSPRSVASASMLAMPDRCTLGLSPEGQYVVVHDGNNIAIWSTETRELIQFRVSKSTLPVSYNTYPCPHLITKTRTTIPSHLENGIPRVQSLMAGRDADLLWLERLSCEPSLWLTLTSDMHQWHHVTRLDRFDDTDPFEPGGPRLTQTIWLNGTLELLLPPDYRPIILDKHRINSQKVWYGDRMVRDKYNLYLPCASKDGTRFLVQGRMRAPIVVDISQVV